jgi:hypothetical protein
VDRDIWDAILAHWPVTLYVPSILIILVILGMITRKWDDKEQQRADVRGSEAAAESAESRAEAAPVTAGAGASAEVAPRERQAA